MSIVSSNYPREVFQELSKQRQFGLTYCDAVLFLPDKSTHLAHKCVLASASTYFENIINNEKYNSPVLQLELDTISTSVGRAIIDYFYTGELRLEGGDFSEAELLRALEQLRLKKIDPAEIRDFYRRRERQRQSQTAQASVMPPVIPECSPVKLSELEESSITNVTSVTLDQNLREIKFKGMGPTRTKKGTAASKHPGLHQSKTSSYILEHLTTRLKVRQTSQARVENTETNSRYEVGGRAGVGPGRGPEARPASPAPDSDHAQQPFPGH